MIQALDLLLHKEWSAPLDTCPTCGGVKPSFNDTHGEGHEAWCEIASLLEAFDREPEYIQPSNFNPHNE